MKERFHETLTVDQNNSSDQFLIALLNLMKEKSFFDISISELCHTAGLSRTTFYKFFQDKDALLDYLAEDLSLGFVAYKKAFKSTIFLLRRSPLSTIFLSGIKFGNGSMFL